MRGTNQASEKMLRKLGMVYEGTLRREVIIRGVARDAKVFSLLKEEYESKKAALSAKAEPAALRPC